MTLFPVDPWLTGCHTLAAGVDLGSRSEDVRFSLSSTSFGSVVQSGQMPSSMTRGSASGPDLWRQLRPVSFQIHRPLDACSVTWVPSKLNPMSGLARLCSRTCWANHMTGVAWAIHSRSPSRRNRTSPDGCGGAPTVCVVALIVGIRCPTGHGSFCSGIGRQSRATCHRVVTRHTESADMPWHALNPYLEARDLAAMPGDAKTACLADCKSVG